MGLALYPETENAYLVVGRLIALAEIIKFLSQFIPVFQYQLTDIFKILLAETEVVPRTESYSPLVASDGFLEIVQQCVEQAEQELLAMLAWYIRKPGDTFRFFEAKIVFLYETLSLLCFNMLDEIRFEKHPEMMVEVVRPDVDHIGNLFRRTWDLQAGGNTYAYRVEQRFQLIFVRGFFLKLVFHGFCAPSIMQNAFTILCSITA